MPGTDRAYLDEVGQESRRARRRPQRRRVCGVRVQRVCHKCVNGCHWQLATSADLAGSKLPVAPEPRGDGIVSSLRAEGGAGKI